MGLWVRTVQADLLETVDRNRHLDQPHLPGLSHNRGTHKERVLLPKTDWEHSEGSEEGGGDDQPPRILCVGFHLG